jgi:hypothetical protein
LVIAQVVVGKTLSTSARLLPAAAATNFTANADVILKSPTFRYRFTISMRTLFAGPKAPAIVRQPDAITVTEEALLNLNLGGTGSKPITYHWRRNGVAVPNSNSAFFGCAAKASDVGQYTMLVSNSLGSVTVNIATVTVNIPNPIVSSVSPSTATAGQATLLPWVVHFCRSRQAY